LINSSWTKSEYHVNMVGMLRGEGGSPPQGVFRERGPYRGRRSKKPPAGKRRGSSVRGPPPRNSLEGGGEKVLLSQGA